MWRASTWGDSRDRYWKRITRYVVGFGIVMASKKAAKNFCICQRSSGRTNGCVSLLIAHVRVSHISTDSGSSPSNDTKTPSSADTQVPELESPPSPHLMQRNDSGTITVYQIFISGVGGCTR